MGKNYIMLSLNYIMSTRIFFFREKFVFLGFSSGKASSKFYKTDNCI
jgi:hypothetical protein